MRRHPSLVGKIDLDKSEPFSAIGFTRRKATSSNLMIPAGAKKEAEVLFQKAPSKI